MRNIKNLNIWKNDEKDNCTEELFLNTDITELNLSVRSFNCLKRAKCDTIRDVLECIGEEGEGLRRIRNLGKRSETEILEKIEEHRAFCKTQDSAYTKKKVTIIKPAKKIWDREIKEFPLSTYSFTRLKKCGVNTVGDLYAGSSLKSEPGWYAVRELFEKIPSSR